MYIFRYNKKLTGELIGYHLSTMCQVGAKERAKRYSPKDVEGVERQRQIILTNFKSVMDSKEDDKSFFNLWAIKEAYFKDLTFEQVELVAEEVEDVNISYKMTAIVKDGNVTKFENTSLAEGLEMIAKDLSKGAHENEPASIEPKSV